MTKKSNLANPLLCDPETGICEIPGQQVNEANLTIVKSINNKIRVVYFTDPICSSCWGIEPQLRKLKLEYGAFIDLEYRMGGLLPDWNYNSGGISQPSDVAHHWDEVSGQYDMPIDGDVWIEDPLNSSYPPSIAFKAALIQDKEKAFLFMREIREMVFLHKKNITKIEYLVAAAEKVGLNVEQFKTDFEGKATLLFEEDLEFAKTNGVRGFPTIFFINNEGAYEKVYGVKPYALYEAAILKIKPQVVKKEYSKQWKTLFSKYPSLTLKEFSVLSGNARCESEILLNELSGKGHLHKFDSKHGSIWTIK